MERHTGTHSTRQQKIIDGLAFAEELVELFKAGCRLRSDRVFPAVSHLLGHAVREIRNRLSDHIGALRPLPLDAGPRRVDRSQILRPVAPRWVEFISPLLAVDESREPSAQLAHVLVPRAELLQLDRLLTYEASVPNTVRARLEHDLEPLLAHISRARLNELVSSLLALEAHTAAHASGSRDRRDPAVAEQLWDDFEALLFELVGSSVWSYAALDAQIDVLNNL